MLLVEPEAAVVEGEVRRGLALLVANGLVQAVGRPDALEERASGRLALEGTLMPGAIDLQVNGAGGHGVEEADGEALDRIARTVLAHGAAAFLPTLITAPFELLLERVRAVAAWCRGGGPADGALPLGLHVEGPFLELAGAHPAEHLVDPTPERVEALLEAAGGSLRLVTLAPARPGAPAAVRRLVEAGVAVSIGHAGDASRLEACVEAGATLATHLFNVMGPLHHREVGLASRVLDEARLTACLIPDGHHVHPVVLRNAFRVLGPERTVLVTDCMAAAGMPDGEYELSGQPVVLRQGVVRDGAGRLAGSAILMDGALAGFRAALPEADEVLLARIASENPARLLGLPPSTLAPGCPARFTLSTPPGARALRLDV